MDRQPSTPPAVAAPVRLNRRPRLSRFASLVLLQLSLLSSAAAQDPTPGTFENSAFPTREELPEEVVLVVKLVSAQEVQPTTGVVVSGDGLVVVPDAFLEEGLEIVVLDGGGNIARNGRRSRIVARSPSGGLALIEVKGLRRAPARFAAAPGSDGDELRIGAFPPAEQLRSGMGPLWIPVRLSANERARIYGLDPEATMPNVSGPLFNHCEQWVGYGLAAGEASLDTRFQPIVLFARDLARELEALGVTPPTGECPSPPVAQESEPRATTGKDPVADEPDPAQEPVEPIAAENGAERETTAPEPATVEAQVPATEAPGSEAGISPAGTGKGWPSVLLLGVSSALLLSAIAMLALIWRQRGARSSSAGEPDTRVLARGRPRSPADAESDASGSDALPPGCDGALVLRGQDPEGRPLDARAPADSEGFSLRVGRRDADLVLDEASVSREHALIEGRPGAITLSDLGSSNGTRVAGVPALPGERLFVGENDVIMLGDNRLRLAWIGAPSEKDESSDG